MIVLDCGCRIGPVEEDPDELGYWQQLELCDHHRTQRDIGLWLRRN